MLPLQTRPTVAPMLVDTYVLLWVFEGPDQPQYDEARWRIVACIEAGEPLRLLSATVMEVAFVLARADAGYGLSREEIAKALTTIIEDPSLTVDGAAILSRAVQLFVQRSIALQDCYLAAAAEATGERLFSFDKDFDRLRVDGLAI
jgi:predicted nucleic-acid-binding protein